MSSLASGPLLGFNLNGRTLAVQIYDTSGNRLAPTVLELPCHVEGGPQAFLTKLGEMTSRILEEANLPWDSIEGVGVNIPAPLDQGIILDKSKLIHDAWAGWKATQEIEAYFTGKPVVVENDANAAAFGEWSLLGPEKQDGTMVLVTVGPGIGGGLIHNGQVLRGQGSAGELGRLMISMDLYDYYRYQDWCSPLAGTHVCRTIEDIASTVAMEHQLEEVFTDPRFDPENRHPLRNYGRTDGGRLDWSRMALHVHEIADSGDELCLNLFRLREEALGRLFATIGLILDPHVFVIGGSATAEWSSAFRHDFLAGVIRHMKEQLLLVKPYSVIATDLGDEAGPFGAAMMTRYKIRNSPLIC